VRHGGLGIARSLGRFGARVFVVDPDRGSPAVLSRYCHGHFQWDFERSPAKASVDFLLEAARKIGLRPILIPSTDAAALLVARHAEALRGSYVFPGQAPETTVALANKASMFHLARRYGVPTPNTF